MNNPVVDREAEIKAKKIIIHKKIHTLLQEIKSEYLTACREPGEIASEN